MNLYQALMSEAKERIDEIGFRLAMIKTEPTARTSAFEAEFAYLQMRYLCEIVALACLSAHQSYGLTASLKKEWNADEIF
jgi:hypothetical protein